MAELEWLSRFVDDSFSDFPKNSITGTLTVRSDTSLSGSGRGKRSKATNSITSSNTTTWTWTSETGNLKPKRETHHRQSSPSLDGGARRCTHCQSEKTPQWRTGPLGPKTLCNACGVRYKSGRLVPEYRPAASPTFVLTQHSNSHRKVLELRRQKEMLRQQQQQQGQSPSQMFRHQRDFEVCWAVIIGLFSDNGSCERGNYCSGYVIRILYIVNLLVLVILPSVSVDKKVMS